MLGDTAPESVTAALDEARLACAALDDEDPKREKMQSFLDDVSQRLQRPPPFVKPRLPDNRRDFVGRNEIDPRRPARSKAFDAMETLLDAAWPKAPAVSGADRMFSLRKRQKQQHEKQQHETQMDAQMLDVDNNAGAPARRL